MLASLTSCVIGTDPCDDSTGTAVGLPVWIVVLAIVIGLALLTAFVAILVRANRR